jgi:hypothetical protein
MSLPTMGYPIYELKLPSNGRVIKVKPFIVKQEKILLMAAESGDDTEIVNATKQVLKECILDDDVNIDKLPFFDVDYLFIALRAKSIGEKIDMQFQCNNEVDDRKCGNIFRAEIDIADAAILRDETVTETISIEKDLTVKMKYPSYTLMRLLPDSENIIERKLRVMVNCIDSIITKDSVNSAKDYSKEELKNFIESMTEENFRKLERFVDNFPSFEVQTQTTCGRCGFEHTLKYKDFASFFQ